MTTFGDLGAIEMQSGVNDKHEPFVSIRVTGSLAKGNIILLGQLDPAEIRLHAMCYLEAAEAAEQDAHIYDLLTELEMPAPAIGKFISDLRARRS